MTQMSIFLVVTVEQIGNNIILSKFGDYKKTNSHLTDKEMLVVIKKKKYF